MIHAFPVAESSDGVVVCTILYITVYLVSMYKVIWNLAQLWGFLAHEGKWLAYLDLGLAKKCKMDLNISDRKTLLWVNK